MKYKIIPIMLFLVLLSSFVFAQEEATEGETITEYIYKTLSGFGSKFIIFISEILAPDKTETLTYPKELFYDTKVICHDMNLVSESKEQQTYEATYDKYIIQGVINTSMMKANTNSMIRISAIIDLERHFSSYKIIDKDAAKEILSVNIQDKGTDLIMQYVGV